MSELNTDTKNFIEELKNNPNVLGVILFGSWARGNNRPDSDVDLIIIQKDRFKRAVEKRNNQIFEIIYTTSNSALDFWRSKLDDAASLWEVAKILFDRDGTVDSLQSKIRIALDKGKPIIDSSQKEQFKFDAEDQIKYVEYIKSTDIPTANLILNNKVFDLTSKYFDLRQLWTPAPKQRLLKVEELEPELFADLVEFYSEYNLDKKIDIVKRIVGRVFTN